MNKFLRAVGAVMMVALAGEATAQAAECKVPEPLQMFPLAALFCVRVYDLPVGNRHCCGWSYHVKNSTHHDRKWHEHKKLIEGRSRIYASERLCCPHGEVDQPLN